jgi:hypothetical protein
VKSEFELMTSESTIKLNNYLSQKFKLIKINKFNYLIITLMQVHNFYKWDCC